MLKKLGIELDIFEKKKKVSFCNTCKHAGEKQVVCENRIGAKPCLKNPKIVYQDGNKIEKYYAQYKKNKNYDCKDYEYEKKRDKSGNRCRYCRAKIDNDDKNCENCGAPV